MLVCDYIVEFFIKKGITDVFGYPGGMVTYLMESLSKNENKINTHTTYHEQAASFAACGYAQVKNLPGVAYATSGPGATNLITGIANAYFDSIGVIFITGQVNTYEGKDGLKVRQRGFQETDIVTICKPITKYAVKITNPEEIVYELEKAYYEATNNRKGPVLLDIPMNIQRSEIDLYKCNKYKRANKEKVDYEKITKIIIEKIKHSKCPMIIVGNGLNKNIKYKNLLNNMLQKIQIPVVTSMISIDAVENCYEYNMGFIGAYGHRWANFSIMKSDLVIVCGSRLDCRQISNNRGNFAPKADIIRIDIDEEELNYKIRENDVNFKADINFLIELLSKEKLNKLKIHNKWRFYCKFLKKELRFCDKNKINFILEQISSLIEDDLVITTDVGQNQVWLAQSFKVKRNQKILFSGGHGAMGYSLPSAIGAFYASHKPVICFTGDGGLQMNIQELQFIKENNIPVKVILLNNHSLGMIRHFQEMYFDENYTQTIKNKGYSVPNFLEIAIAYGIDAYNLKSTNSLKEIKNILKSSKPAFINIDLPEKTYVYPKLAVNKPLNDQEPVIDREKYNKLMEMI